MAKRPAPALSRGIRSDTDVTGQKSWVPSQGVAPPRALSGEVGDWPDFVDPPPAARSVPLMAGDGDSKGLPRIAFWLVFLGGVAVGFIGACVLAWSVLA